MFTVNNIYTYVTITYMLFNKDLTQNRMYGQLNSSSEEVSNPGPFIGVSQVLLNFLSI